MSNLTNQKPLVGFNTRANVVYRSKSPWSQTIYAEPIYEEPPSPIYDPNHPDYDASVYDMHISGDLTYNPVSPVYQPDDASSASDFSDSDSSDNDSSESDSSDSNSSDSDSSDSDSSDDDSSEDDVITISDDDHITISDDDVIMISDDSIISVSDEEPMEIDDEPVQGCEEWETARQRFIQHHIDMGNIRTETD
ncbi:Oidioi.mRNA.OKI2018_I69.chr1.g2575.t1.cds [Oikopleura dioica]|uniref:Oidioi.mRNA.OKI2018_I69.chr1.g2575.t1.cds n=1 Tax=Oikopleura dioica TaxID=34765 RepID=A0ABN7SRI7_OIKDI|nr:Oidioi.mRNA.OKI2018_I69.chr1.g2575.t1.cds [Oikopleura dioica]